MGTSEDVIHKVLAYVTHQGRLLVFSHPQHPEAGIQVPGGTVKEGESPRSAILREAREETGLENAEVISYLGARDRDVSSSGQVKTQRRHFYHLVFHGQAPERWRHYEMHPSDGSPAPIEFELFWVRFPDRVPKLSGGQGDLLPRLASRWRAV